MPASRRGRRNSRIKQEPEEVEVMISDSGAPHASCHTLHATHDCQACRQALSTKSKQN